MDDELPQDKGVDDNGTFEHFMDNCCHSGCALADWLAGSHWRRPDPYIADCGRDHSDLQFDHA
jgi:hypothetical protein